MSSIVAMSVVTAMPVLGMESAAVWASYFGQRSFTALVAERSQLHEQERELALFPDLAPPANESSHQVAIVHPLASIGLSLIPDCPFESERHQRVDHPVVKARGL